MKGYYIVRAVLKKEYHVKADSLEQACDDVFEMALDVLPPGYDVDDLEVYYE